MKRATAVAVAVSLVLAGGAMADTIDVAFQYVTAGGEIDCWLGSTHFALGHNWADGIQKILTQNPSGSLATQVPVPTWASCFELGQNTDWTSSTYNVSTLSSALDAPKANLIRQLWGQNYDSAGWDTTTAIYGLGGAGWVAGEPASTATNVNALAFIYAIYEIRYDYDGTLGSLNLAADSFQMLTADAGTVPTGVQTATQNMLDGLVDPGSYSGPLPGLLALTSSTHQDLIVTPEPATMALMALGGVGLLARRRGKK